MTIFRSRNATAASRVVADVPGPTGRRHAPTTYSSTRSKRSQLCKRAKPAYRVGEFSLVERPAPTGLFTGLSFPSIRGQVEEESLFYPPFRLRCTPSLMLLLPPDSGAMRRDRFANDASLPDTKTNACTMPPRSMRLLRPPHPRPADLRPDGRRHWVKLRTSHSIYSRYRILRIKASACLERLLSQMHDPPFPRPSLNCNRFKNEPMFFSLKSRTPIIALTKPTLTKNRSPTPQTPKAKTRHSQWERRPSSSARRHLYRPLRFSSPPSPALLSQGKRFPMFKQTRRVRIIPSRTLD